MNTSFKRYSIAAELLTCIVYQQYMPTEIQLRYKTSISPNVEATKKALSSLFSFSIVTLFMADGGGTYYQKCALWIAISQNYPKYFHK